MKRVKEIIEMNKRGKRPEDLLEQVAAPEVNRAESFTHGGFGGKIEIVKKKKQFSKPITKKNKPN